MRKLMLAVAATGALGLAATATPANAGVFTGLQTPEFETNRIDARCHHHRWSSRWHCYRRHHRWRSHRYYRRHYYYGPQFYGPGFYHRRYWW